MRIVGKQEFYTLPEGTVYSRYLPQVFDGLYVKQETIEHFGKPADFIYQSLLDTVESNDFGEMSDILDNALKTGQSFKMDYDCTMRDGLFDDDQLFAIYEPDDLKGLISVLEAALFVTKPT